MECPHWYCNAMHCPGNQMRAPCSEKHCKQKLAKQMKGKAMRCNTTKCKAEQCSPAQCRLRGRLRSNQVKYNAIQCTIMQEAVRPRGFRNLRDPRDTVCKLSGGCPYSTVGTPPYDASAKARPSPRRPLPPPPPCRNRSSGRSAGPGRRPFRLPHRLLTGKRQSNEFPPPGCWAITVTGSPQSIGHAAGTSYMFSKSASRGQKFSARMRR